MKSNESVTVIAKRLNDMLEMKDTDEEEKYRQKKVISSNLIIYNTFINLINIYNFFLLNR